MAFMQTNLSSHLANIDSQRSSLNDNATLTKAESVPICLPLPYLPSPDLLLQLPVPLPQSALSLDLVPIELTRVFRDHAPHLARLVSGERNPQEQHAQDHQRFLLDLRGALGIRNDAQINFSLTQVGPVVYSLPVRDLCSLDGDSSFSISNSTGQVLLDGVLNFNRTAHPELLINPESAYGRATGPMWLRAMIRDDISPQRRREIEELQERRQLSELLLPCPRPHSVGEYIRDPGLQHHVSVFRELGAYIRGERSEARELLQELTHGEPVTNVRRAEIAAWVSRMLVADSLSPSQQNIRSCLESISNSHAVAQCVPIFARRNILVAASADLLTDLNWNSRRELSGAVVNHADYHLFASSPFLQRLQQTGANSVSLLRARPEINSCMESFLRSHSATLCAPGVNSNLENIALSWMPASRPGETPQQRQEALNNLSRVVLHRFTNNVREILGLPADQEVRFDFSVADDRRSGRFRVYRAGSDAPVYDARLSIREGQLDRLTSAEINNLPARQAISPQSTHEQILRSIRTSPPGESGFTFIFSGHGAPNALLIGSTQANSSVRISPRELADAIIARRERFGERATENDMYVLLSCHSQEFLREVGQLLRASTARPLLYSCTEHGQVGFQRVGDQYSTPDFQALLDEDRRLRGRGEVTTVRDLIRLMMQRTVEPIPQQSTNPSLFLPIRRPGQTQRQHHQISGNTQQRDYDLG